MIIFEAFRYMVQLLHLVHIISLKKDFSYSEHRNRNVWTCIYMSSHNVLQLTCRYEQPMSISQSVFCVHPSTLKNNIHLTSRELSKDKLF